MVKKVQDLIALLPALKSVLKDWDTEQQIQLTRPKVDLSNRNFYGNKHWKDNTRSSLEFHFRRRKHRTYPIFTMRAVASSGTLVKNTKLISAWKQGARDLMAVEMELSGVYTAARRLDKEYPILAIRGISDIVGFKRSPDWTAYACNTAASFCVTLLHNLPEHYLSSRVLK